MSSSYPASLPAGLREGFILLSCLLAPELSVASQVHTHFHHLLLSYLKVCCTSEALKTKAAHLPLHYHTLQILSLWRGQLPDSSLLLN